MARAGIDPALIQWLGAGGFTLVIFLTGFWLGRSRKPYNGWLLNFHKLTALAACVLFVLMALQMHQLTPLETRQILAVGITVLFFVIAILSGGLNSLQKPMPAALTITHKVIPYLTLLSTAASLYWIAEISRLALE